MIIFSVLPYTFGLFKCVAGCNFVAPLIGMTKDNRKLVTTQPPDIDLHEVKPTTYCGFDAKYGLF